MSSARLATITACVFAAALLLYGAGATPEFATDDSAEFQRLAPRLQRLHPPGYPVQLLFGGAARLAGERGAARAMTLLSALWSAAAVAAMFWAITILARSAWGGAVAAASLAVSHTFWMHASLAEAYAFNSLCLAVVLALFAWSERRPTVAPRALVATAWLIGFGAANHLTLLLAAPVVGLVYLARFPAARAPLPLVATLVAGAAALVATHLVLPIRFAALDDPSIASSGRTPWEFAWWWARGGPSQGLLFTFGPAALAKRLATFVAYLGYQFPSPAALFALAGAAHLWRARRLALLALLAGILLTNLAYALNFDSSDVYVFYGACHAMVAAAAGLGLAPAIAWIRARVRAAHWSSPALATLLCALLPPLVYTTVPTLLDRANVILSPDKGNRYYLWPPKRAALATWNAQAEALAATLPAGSILMTDWNTLHLLSAHLERAGRLHEIWVMNAPRAGEAIIPTNWASLALDALLVAPDRLIVAPGPIPGLEHDPVFRSVPLGGFWATHMATRPPPPALVPFAAAYREALRPALAARGLVAEDAAALPTRPFHDAAGRVDMVELEIGASQTAPRPASGS